MQTDDMDETNLFMEKLKHEFQARLGPLPVMRVEYHPYPRHADLIQSVLLTRPSSLTEVVRVVRTASTMKLRVRSVGKRSNYQEHLYSDEISVLIDMCHLRDDPKIEVVDYKMPDLQRVMAVRVLAGVTMQELCDFQVRNQIKVAANVSDAHHTVVGAIVSGLNATSNKRYATLADQVLQLRAVDRCGHLVEFKDQLDAIVSLGMTGVVYDVILRVEEMDCVEVRYAFERAGDFEESPKFLKLLLDQHDSVRLLYYPMNSLSKQELSQHRDESLIQLWDPQEDEVIVRLTDVSPKDPGERETLYVSDQYSSELHHVEDPQKTPAFLQSRHLQQKIDKKSTVIQYFPWAIHCYEDAHKDNNYRQSDLTVTVPVDQDVRAFGQILAKIQGVVKHFGRESNYPLNICVRVDFTPGSQCRLAPGFDERRLPPKNGTQYDSQKDDEVFWYAHIRFTSLRGSDEVWAEACSHLMEALWSVDISCIMQWNSDWTFVKGYAPALSRYHEKSKEHLKKVLELVDRDGMFLNETLMHIFYPSAEGYRGLYESQRKMFLEKLRKLQ